jgi:hypothetical protein
MFGRVHFRENEDVWPSQEDNTFHLDLQPFDQESIQKVLRTFFSFRSFASDKNLEQLLSFWKVFHFRLERSCLRKKFINADLLGTLFKTKLTKSFPTRRKRKHYNPLQSFIVLSYNLLAGWPEEFVKNIAQ